MNTDKVDKTTEVESKDKQISNPLSNTIDFNIIDLPLDNITKDELQEKSQFLKLKIEQSIESSRKNKRINRKKASNIKVIILSFSGLATILLGLQIAGVEKYFKEIAFVLGALVTILNAIEPYFNFRELWVEHEASSARFHRLKDRIDFYLSGCKTENLNAQVIYKFFEDYNDIWIDVSRSWISHRKKSGGQS